MKKFTHKLIAIVLCVAMIGGLLPMGAAAVEDETVYTLYPTPHSIEYGDGSFELTDIHAVYGNGIDDYTKARLEETAALLDLEVTDAGETDVYVAIYGSGDAAEQYILNNYTVDTTLFTKIDANFVAVKDGEIVVLGKDTDSAFYGLTTLYQIFGQLTGTTLRNLTINDYADVASRGFIEGYYGNPWSVEDRANLMTWGGYYKLNSYFYAPKDDPKHNANWRELYTEEEIDTLIRPLAEAGNASKCRFVYALHPYMHNPITDSNYDSSMAVLKAKFLQVIEAGVRQIAILADDAGNQGGTHYTKMLTDMTAWINELRANGYPDLKLLLPFVTQEYMYFGESYYRNFPENIQIVMTGGQVWGFCSPSFTNTFYNNVGRGAYLWINWPCTDNSKNHLIMGGYADFLQPGVDPNKVEGIVLNPMQQSEPSKVAIFGNACYTWNMWETEAEADAAWDTAFACVDHNSVVPNDASNALRELSKHMIDQTRFEDNPNVLEESVVLRNELSAFQSKLTAGTYTQDDIDSLVEEFTILQNAAKIYREQGNTAIATQIEPWLGNWDDQTLAILSYLDALSAILNDEGDDVIWGNYATGQSALESSKNHPLWYMDHYEYAESGYRFIVPFMKALDTYLADYVKDIVDPSGGMSGGGSGGVGNPGEAVTGLTAFEGNNPSYYSGTLSAVVDGSTSTSLWYSDYGRVNQYIGVDLGRNVLIGKVVFTQDSGDHFSNYTLQYSTDGVTYHDYKDYTEAVLNVDLSADGIEARYLRFNSNATTSVWIKICEIQVYEASATKVVTNNDSLSSWQTRIGNERAELLTDGTATMAPGDYIGFDLRKIKDLDTITVADQGALTLQVSVNGVDWVNVNARSMTENGRYVRLINLTDETVTTNLTDFVVTSTSYAGPSLLESNIGINSSWGVAEDCRDNGAAFDGNLATHTEFGDFVTTGQYFIYDLGQARDIYKLEIYCADSAVNYIRDAQMQISNDLENWTTVLTIGDGVQNTGEASVTCINSDAGYSQATSAYPNYVSIEGELDEAQTARYIRVIMTAPNDERAVLFTEIEINDGEYVSVNNDLAFEVSHIEAQGYPPQNLVDGDLTTSWKPNTTEAGSLIYTFSDNLTANRINIVSKSASGAHVYLYAENGGEREWIDKGTLDKSLVTLIAQNDLNLALKIEWEANAAPNITEIVRFTEEVVCEHVEEIIPAVAATCTETGLTEGKKCSLCGQVTVAQEVIEALGHEYEATVTAPTCTRGGYTTHDCIRCDDSYVDSYVPAPGHNYEDGICTGCGKSENPSVVPPTNTFTDVTKDDFFYDAVQWAVAEGITTGVTTTRFAPDNLTTRAQIVTFLWRAAGKPEPASSENPFTDVEESEFYYNAVLWAVEQGITKGVTETTFNPDGNCTRAQAVTFLHRYAGEPGATMENPFTDVSDQEFYYNAILWAVEEEITTGITTTTFEPNSGCTRAQIVTFLFRAIK